MSRAPTARLTRDATAKGSIFCARAAFCSIHRTAAAFAATVRPWSSHRGRGDSARRAGCAARWRRDHDARGASRPTLQPAALGVGVAGTSGKSTTVGMIGWILHRAGKSPTIMNGADMKNFIDSGAPFASARVGEGDIFVSEVDESDGSIALFKPDVAVVNNISLDHKSLDELRRLFRRLRRQGANRRTQSRQRGNRRACRRPKPGHAVTYSLRAAQADLVARRRLPRPTGIVFKVKARETGETVTVKLKVPGLHNVSNALAALVRRKGLRRRPCGGGGLSGRHSAASAGDWRSWAPPTTSL